MAHQFVDILEARIPVLPTATRRAQAWAQAIQNIYPEPTTEELAHLIQTLITDERNRVLLTVERALIQEMK